MNATIEAANVRARGGFFGSISEALWRKFLASALAGIIALVGIMFATGQSMVTNAVDDRIHTITRPAFDSLGQEILLIKADARSTKGQQEAFMVGTMRVNPALYAELERMARDKANGKTRDQRAIEIIKILAE